MAEGLARYVRQYRLELNHKGLGAWTRLANEKNLYVLTALFFYWLEHLRVPLFTSEELTTIVLHAPDPRTTLMKLPLEISATIDYILHFVGNLEPEKEALEGTLKRFAAAITHRVVPTVSDTIIYQGFHNYIPDKGKPVIFLLKRKRFTWTVNYNLFSFAGRARKLNDGTLNKLMTALYGIVHIHNSNLIPPPEPEHKPIGAARMEEQARLEAERAAAV